MAKRILLIGAGLTSAIIVNVLKRTQIFNSSTIPIELHIWEKARGAGGRFSTSRSPHNPKCTADLGAQYLTFTLSNAMTQPYFEDLIRNGLISKFATKNITGFVQSSVDAENYVCTNGTASVVKHLLRDTQNISFNKRVASISVTDDGRIKVVPEGQSSESDIFDVVVSTMPVPQLLQLGNMDNILHTSGNPDLKENLMQVTYTSRYALGLFYDVKLSVDPTESCINFVDGNPVIRYWTLEDEKRRLGETNAKQDSHSSAVIHTSVSFGAKNIDRDAKDVQELLLKRVADTCKSLRGKDPAFVKCQKWRYSQIGNGYAGSPGFVILSESPLILAAGDGFVKSGFENCILSGERTAQYLAEHVMK